MCFVASFNQVIAKTRNPRAYAASIVLVLSALASQPTGLLELDAFLARGNFPSSIPYVVIESMLDGVRACRRNDGFGWRSAGVAGEPDFGFWVAQRRGPPRARLWLAGVERFSAAIRAPLPGGFSR